MFLRDKISTFLKLTINERIQQLYYLSTNLDGQILQLIYVTNYYFVITLFIHNKIIHYSDISLSSVVSYSSQPN